MYKLSPSILSANFLELGKEIKNIEKAKAHYLHIDIMDGHFVPNISLGIPIIQSIRKATNMILDVHLMISEPEKYIETFAKEGSDIINIHLESFGDIFKNINLIKYFNKKAALTIKPNTNIESIFPYLELLDMVLIMSVKPGFGGQKFIKESLNKTEKLANYLINNKINIDIEIDGGINLQNVEDVINAGANVIVAGSSIFKAENISEAVKSFYRIFKKYEITRSIK